MHVGELSANGLADVGQTVGRYTSAADLKTLDLLRKSAGLESASTERKLLRAPVPTPVGLSKNAYACSKPTAAGSRQQAAHVQLRSPPG